MYNLPSAGPRQGLPQMQQTQKPAAQADPRRPEACTPTERQLGPVRAGTATAPSPSSLRSSDVAAVLGAALPAPAPGMPERDAGGIAAKGLSAEENATCKQGTVSASASFPSATQKTPSRAAGDCMMETDSACLQQALAGLGVCADGLFVQSTIATDDLRAPAAGTEALHAIPGGGFDLKHPENGTANGEMTQNLTNAHPEASSGARPRTYEIDSTCRLGSPTKSGVARRCCRKRCGRWRGVWDRHETEAAPQQPWRQRGVESAAWGGQSGCGTSIAV